MKSKICFLMALAIVVEVGGASASQRALYRIELRDGSEVLARYLPYRRGSVVLFHGKGGVLTGLPAEEVVRVRRSAVDAMVVAKRDLHPGDVVFLGPTAGTPLTVSTPAAGAAAVTLPGGVYDPRNPAFGYSAPRNSANVVGVSVAPAAGDVGRAISAEPPTGENPIGPNGFPTTPAGASPMVGPDGQPILAVPAGSSGTTPVTIGPNGTPVLSPAGAPGSFQPPIGPNGTPVLAPAGTPGATSPPVGSNGYPAPKGPGR
jgi:hypothetical protein